MIKISKYIDPHLILFLNAHSHGEVISQLVDALHTAGKLKNRDLFLEAIGAREKIASTGIGMSVAIPHAKLPCYDDFFVAIAVLSQGVDWDALDGAPVRLVFMIGGPDNRQTEYLQILSLLTLAIKDEERRKKMLTLRDAKEMIKLFQAF